MLIESFIETLSYVYSLGTNNHEHKYKLTQPSPNDRTRSRENDFIHEIRFAKEHELAWLLRWALSRITRIKEGTRITCHGVMEWEMYEEWRGRERGKHHQTPLS